MIVMSSDATNHAINSTVKPPLSDHLLYAVNVASQDRCFPKTFVVMLFMVNLYNIIEIFWRVVSYFKACRCQILASNVSWLLLVHPTRHLLTIL